MSWWHLFSYSFVLVEKFVLHAIVGYICFCVMQSKNTRAQEYSPFRVPPELHGLMWSDNCKKNVSLCERFITSPASSWLLPVMLAFFASLFFVLISSLAVEVGVPSGSAASLPFFEIIVTRVERLPAHCRGYLDKLLQ